MFFFIFLFFICTIDLSEEAFIVPHSTYCIYCAKKKKTMQSYSALIMCKMHSFLCIFGLIFFLAFNNKVPLLFDLSQEMPIFENSGKM